MEPVSDEKFIRDITAIVRDGILNQEDKRTIYCVCLVACGRELAALRKEGQLTHPCQERKQ